MKNNDELARFIYCFKPLKIKEKAASKREKKES